MAERTINVLIAGRSYELRSKSPEHEEMIREAAAQVNAMIDSYSGRYPTRDLTAFLTFISLNECMSNIKLQRDLQKVREEIAELDGEIDDYLGNA